MNQEALASSLGYLDNWLQFRYSREDLPGISIAISQNGNLLLNRTCGYANLSNKTKLTSNHLFRIASHSKTFTATAIMQLQVRSKLRIDDYICDYLSWLKDHTDKRWQRVTIRQLMSHSAGIIRDGTSADYWQLLEPFPDEKRLKTEILSSSLIIDNNTRLKYSNFGYGLLGLLIETVSDQTYSDYVTRNIIESLNLKNTFPDYAPAIKTRIATVYSRADLDRTRQPLASTEVSTNAMAPATGFYSTAEDLCKYFSAQLVGSGKLLDDESKKEMQRVQFHAENLSRNYHEDYGLGFEIEYPENRKTFGHSGGFPGFITCSAIDPKDNLAVVILTNCNNSPASLIVDATYEIIDYFQKNTPSTKPKHNLAKLAGRYYDLFSINDIVVTGDKVIASYPDSWRPFANPEELEYIDDTTFKISKASSFSSEGELVRFGLENGAVKSINYAGSTQLPEKVWLRRLAKN